MADSQKSNLLAVPQCTSPREQVTVLQEETARSLSRDGANTNVPCPVADEIFEQLFGQIWLRATIIRSHKSAEELLELIKLDYDATIEFYMQRRESTNRGTLNLEDDEKLQSLLAEKSAAEEQLARLSEKLEELEERERQQMASWLGQYGIAQLMHQGRVAGLTAQADNLKLRSSLLDLLDDEGDLLTGVDELLAWVSDEEGDVASQVVPEPGAEETPQEGEEEEPQEEGEEEAPQEKGVEENEVTEL